MSLTGHRNPPTSQLTRVRMFLNPEPFFRIQNFHVYTYPYSNRIGPSTRIRTYPDALQYGRRTPLGILAKEHASKSGRNLHLALPCVMILDFIARIMVESAQKSKENAKSKVLLPGNEGCHLKQNEYSIHGKELGWILLRYRIKKNLDLACTRFRIHSVLKNFYFGKRIQKVANSNAGYTGHPTEHLPVRSLRVDGSRIRKEKVVDSKISWYVWMGSKLRLANKNCTINIKLKKCSLFLAMRGAKPRSK